MATLPTKRRYLQEIDRLAPAIRREFLFWVGDRVGLTDLSDIVDFISIGDVNGILDAIGVNEASLSDLTEAIRATYIAGGKFEAPAAQIMFNVRAEEAESWLREEASQLVTDITEGTAKAIRAALEAGLRQGQNPTTTALDLVGRIGPNGRRSGGIVGLTGIQSGYVATARMELLSGEPALLRNYLRRQRRDKRFDRTIERAIRTGIPLTRAQVDTIAGRYADRLLKLRGDTIARTETIASMNAARHQAWEQAIAEGKILPEFITKIWSATMDSRTRDSHESLNGQRRNIREPFHSETGAYLMYPGDSSLNAGPEDVINCRCFLESEADFIAMAAYDMRRVA